MAATLQPGTNGVLAAGEREQDRVRLLADASDHLLAAERISHLISSSASGSAAVQAPPMAGSLHSGGMASGSGCGLVQGAEFAAARGSMRKRRGSPLPATRGRKTSGASLEPPRNREPFHA